MASALAWNRRGSRTSEPNTSWAVKPCRISHTLVRRPMMVGRSARLIRWSYSPAATAAASCGSLAPRPMLTVNRYANVATRPTTVST